MIKADTKKATVEINGDIVQILDEFTLIIRRVRELLSGVEDETFAERTIAFCVMLSKKTPEELEEEAKRHETDDTKSAN